MADWTIRHGNGSKGRLEVRLRLKRYGIKEDTEGRSLIGAASTPNDGIFILLIYAVLIEAYKQ